MLRGIKTFKSLTEDQALIKSRKGRSDLLISLRNDCMLDRFYYYVRLSGQRYDVIIERLSVEFFLSKITVTDLIGRNADRISAIKKQYKEVADKELKKAFTKKWGHLIWDDLSLYKTTVQ